MSVEEQSKSDVTSSATASSMKEGKGDSAVRALLAKQNKDLFEKIRQEAMTNTEVLQKFKDYDAQSHKDKVTAAQSVADLRVSYFHYNSQAFQRYLNDIWESLQTSLPPSKRRKLNDAASTSTSIYSTTPTQIDSMDIDTKLQIPKVQLELPIVSSTPKPGIAELAAAASSDPILAQMALKPVHVRLDNIYSINYENASTLPTGYLKTCLGDIERLMKCLPDYQRMIQSEINRRPQALCVVFWVGERAPQHIIDSLKAELPDVILYDGAIDPFKSLKKIILLEALHGFRQQGYSLKDLLPIFKDKEKTMDLLTETTGKVTPKIEIEDRQNVIVLLSDRPSAEDREAMKVFPLL
eukprot:TRINITY_DN10780_c0_g1_i1.p1 TRINITY_DN10780_c0_g1~~TRINITY_DN10780_c0_g1_i1.p1  ORF type:complete len:363 (-),score=72.86 TRINITY_DN10780_c0_g1_i1:314-1372(-)